jgi:hypothetical protein
MKYKIDLSVIENNVEHKEILYVIPSSDDELQSALELWRNILKRNFAIPTCSIVRMIAIRTVLAS